MAWTHTDYCDGECNAEDWEQPPHWNQPERMYVQVAEDELGRDAPWCRIHERAHQLIREAE